MSGVGGGEGAFVEARVDESEDTIDAVGGDVGVDEAFGGNVRQVHLDAEKFVGGVCGLIFGGVELGRGDELVLGARAANAKCEHCGVEEGGSGGAARLGVDYDKVVVVVLDGDGAVHAGEHGHSLGVAVEINNGGSEAEIVAGEVIVLSGWRVSGGVEVAEGRKPWLAGGNCAVGHGEVRKRGGERG